MSLGYPRTSPLTYTPFVKTSFGFGADELQNLSNNPFPNPTDWAKVVITAYLNWTNESHIKTEEVNSAVSVYNKETSTWTVQGERDDVEQILAQLEFYPPTNQDVLDWQPTFNKFNDTSGVYFGDSPNDTIDIEETKMDIVVYNSTGYVVGYDIWIDAAPVEYTNKRPYFSEVNEANFIEPSDYDSGATMFFGTVEDGGDGDNLKIICSFKEYPDFSFNRNSDYGYFDYEHIYVGSKKASDSIAVQEELNKFEFVGSKDECQSFLDNIMYVRNGNLKSVITTFYVDDGQMRSEVNTLLAFRQTLQLNVLPSQSYTEDQLLSFNFGTMTVANEDNIPEVQEWIATLAFDSIGLNAIGSIDVNGTPYYIISNNELRIEANSLNELNTKLNSTEIRFKQDFNSSFNFDFTLTANGYQLPNGQLSSTYDSTTQTIGVTGISQVEVQPLVSNHTYIEDRTYYLNPTLEIVHPYNEQFEYVFTLSNPVVGTLTNDGNNLTDHGNGVYSIVGTKNSLNYMLSTLKFIPVVDSFANFSISFTLNRLSGDLNYHVQSTGNMYFFGTPVIEHTPASSTIITWDEDITETFDSGISIVDESTLNPDYPNYYQTEYKVEARLKYTDGPNTYPLETAYLDTGNGQVLSSQSGNGTVSNPLTFTGIRSAINTNLASMQMIPFTDWHTSPATDGSFFIEYRITRLADNVVYTDYGERTNFAAGIPSPEFTVAESFNYGLERVLDMSSMYEIVDVAWQKQYQVIFTFSSNAEGKMRGYPQGSATLEWDSEAKALELTGSKADINATIQTLEFIPDFNFNSDFTISYYQLQTTNNLLHADGQDSIDMFFDPTILPYDVDTFAYYSEDLVNQTPLTNTTFKLEDAAQDIIGYYVEEDYAEPLYLDNVEYKVSLRLDPTDQLFFTDTSIASRNGQYVDDPIYTGTELIRITGTSGGGIIGYRDFNNVISVDGSSTYISTVSLTTTQPSSGTYSLYDDITITATVDVAPSEDLLIPLYGSIPDITILAGETTASLTFSIMDYFYNEWTADASWLELREQVLANQGINSGNIVEFDLTYTRTNNILTVIATIDTLPQTNMTITLSNGEQIIIPKDQTTGSVTFSLYNLEYVDLDYTHQDFFTMLYFIGTKTQVNDFVRNVNISGYPDKYDDVDVHFSCDRWIDYEHSRLVANDGEIVTLQSTNSLEVATYNTTTQYISTIDTDNPVVMPDNTAWTSRKIQEQRSMGYQYYKMFDIVDNSAFVSQSGNIYEPKYRISCSTPGIITEDTWYTKTQFNNLMNDGLVGITGSSDILNDGDTVSATINIERFFQYDAESRTFDSGNITIIKSLNVDFKFLNPQILNYDTDEVVDTVYVDRILTSTNQYSIIDNWEDKVAAGDASISYDSTKFYGTPFADLIQFSGHSTTSLVDYGSYSQFEQNDLENSTQRIIDLTVNDLTYKVKRTYTVSYRKTWTYDANRTFANKPRSIYVTSQNAGPYEGWSQPYISSCGNYTGQSEWYSPHTSSYGGITLTDTGHVNATELDIPSYLNLNMFDPDPNGYAGDHLSFVTWTTQTNQALYNNIEVKTFFDYDPSIKQVTLNLQDVSNPDDATSMNMLVFQYTWTDGYGIGSYVENVQGRDWYGNIQRNWTVNPIGLGHKWDVNSYISNAVGSNNFNTLPSAATNVNYRFILNFNQFTSWYMEFPWGGSDYVIYRVVLPHWYKVRTYDLNGSKYEQVMLGSFTYPDSDRQIYLWNENFYEIYLRSNSVLPEEEVPTGQNYTPNIQSLIDSAEFYNSILAGSSGNATIYRNGIVKP